MHEEHGHGHAPGVYRPPLSSATWLRYPEPPGPPFMTHTMSNQQPKSSRVFDPIIQRRKRTRHQTIASSLQERAEAFRNDVLSALTEYPDILDDKDDKECNQLTKELTLIVATGGLQAAMLLKDCLQLIPNTYEPKDRIAYVEKILGSAIQLPTDFLPHLCRSYGTFGIDLNATMATLKSLSMSTGTPYTYFIAPVSTCLHCTPQHTLHRHHPPKCVGRSPTWNKNHPEV